MNFYKKCVSRLDPLHIESRKRQTSVEPTFKIANIINNQKKQLVKKPRADNSQRTIELNTEPVLEEDTPSYRKNLQKVSDLNFIAAATRQDWKIKRILIFSAMGTARQSIAHLEHTCLTYRFNIQTRKDCLLIDVRTLKPTQLRQTVFHSIHMTCSESAAILNLCEFFWFWHIHQSSWQVV